MKTKKLFVWVMSFLVLLIIPGQSFGLIDDKASLENVIYMLQVLTGLRQSEDSLMARGTGIIEGRVVKDTGDSNVWEPIPDAEVVCQMENGELLPVKTDQNGFFKITNLPSGPKVINIFKQGFESFHTNITVGEGVISNILFRAKPSGENFYGSLDGVILTPTNDGQLRPVPEAVVKIYQPGNSIPSILTNFTEPEDFPSVKTNTDGYFRFDKLPEGNYVVIAEKTGFNKGFAIAHIDTEKTARVDIIIFPENIAGFGTLFGRVVEKIDNLTDAKCGWDKIVGINGASVKLISNDGSINFSATTGEKGFFHIQLVPVGIYQLVVEHPSFESYKGTVEIKEELPKCLPTFTPPVDSLTANNVSAPENDYRAFNQFMNVVKIYGTGCFCIDPNGNWHQGVNFVRVILKRTVPQLTTLSGYVYGMTEGEKKPLSGVTISVSQNFPYPTVAPLLKDSTNPSFAPLPIYTATSGDDGFYKFSNLPPGEYKVWVIVDGYHPWESLIKVLDGIDNKLNILLTPITAAASLNGHVYNGAYRCLAESGIVGDRCISPVPKAEIYLFYQIKTFTDIQVPSYRTVTDESGYFTFPKINTGEYHMIVKADKFLPWEKSIKIIPGENTIDVVLYPRVGCESGCGPNEYCAKPIGKCDDPGVCAPKPDVCMDLYAPVCGCDGKTYNNACLAALNGVNIRYEGACASENPGSLSGNVYQATSGERKILSDIPIVLYYFEPTGQAPPQTRSNTDGYYEFKELPPGTYTIFVDAPGFLKWKKEIRIISGEMTRQDIFLSPVSATGFLKGKIMDPSADCPVQDCIGIKDAVVVLFPLTISSATTIPEYKTLTNETGNYEIINLPVGDYRMIVKAEGYRSVEELIRIEAGENIRNIGLIKITVCLNNADCSQDEFCSKPHGSCNGEGICTKVASNMFCIMLYDPVCGCDGKTYGNSCEALRAGANIAYKGACFIKP